MYARPLVLIGLLSLVLQVTAASHPLRAVHIRQDPAEGSGETGGEEGTGGEESPSEAVTAAETVAETAESTEPVEASPTAAASAAASGSSRNALGGAGSGGVYPTACQDCLNTFSLVASCDTQGSSESCSPICTDFTSATTCLSCLVQNGQSGADQSAVQQIVWNLEANCANLDLAVASIEITATPTTTGPFSTPVGASTTPAPSGTGSASTSKHSGLTNYNTTTRQPKVSGPVSTINAITSISSTGGGMPRATGVAKGAYIAIGVAGLGALVV